MNYCKIVMYHYVRPSKESKYPKIKGLELEGFIRQLNYFRNNFKFISATSLIDAIYNSKEIPSNSVLLTFDDGFNDHYQHVFPLLKKFHIQGLFFPPAMPLEENVVLDVHKIHFILASCKNINELSKELIELIRTHRDEYNLQDPEFYLSKIVTTSRFDNRETIFIKKTLQSALPSKARKGFLNYLFQNYVTKDEKSFSKQLHLSYEQINEMSENGMFFGSHSYYHEWFDHLSENDIKVDLEKSSDFLKKINKNRDYWIMCYPYGNYNEIVIQNLKKRGYKAGLTVVVGDALLTKENAFKLNRYDTNDFPQ